MNETANLKLPLVAPAQAQKHVTVNEALARIDAALQLAVISDEETTPPVLAQEGDAYVVAAGGVNDWAGKDGQLAFYLNGGWDFLEPKAGWRIWVTARAVRLVHDGSGWVEGVVALSPGGAAMRAQIEEVDLVLSGGGAAELTGFVIPANSCVFGVTGRVLQDITGTLGSWTLGVEGAEDRYGSGLGLGAGSWVTGLTGQPQVYYSATRLKLSAAGGDFSGGTVRLAVHLMQFDLPEA
ncbi:MAG: DUF2793 domain-containing protein [Paracoccaceae bacterium]